MYVLLETTTTTTTAAAAANPNATTTSSSSDAAQAWELLDNSGADSEAYRARGERWAEEDEVALDLVMVDLGDKNGE